MATSVDARIGAARRTPFWLDTSDRPPARPSLDADTSCELAIVGGGFSGLWTAVLAKEADPDRDVLLLEGGRLAWAATGRNGGFCAASLTHGYDNGVSRFGEPAQAELDRLGMANLDQIQEAVARYGIDCHFERTGEVDVATAAYQLPDPATVSEGVYLDRQAVRAELDSPTFLGGVWDKHGVAMLDPARLAWGLADVAERLGVRIVEQTPVRALRKAAGGIELATEVAEEFVRDDQTSRGPAGFTVRADRVALATNIFPSLLRRLRLFCVPVYDHVLMTEPLTDEQLGAIGWRHRQGFGDSGNQFHYYRLTADNRILWGGYDAVYHYGRRMKPAYDDRADTYRTLAEHFDATFPQLAGIGFSHRWGGAIDTCTRFCAFFGAAYDHRVAYALGYTGLGVGASRFGGQVMLDLLDGAETERTRTPLVQSRPLPFPPEPLAFLGIEATRRSLAHADDNEGRRNLWLRSLDNVGLGFDS